MGLAKNQKHEAMERKGKRGSKDNQSRLDAFNRVSSSEGADWGGCDPVKLQGVIEMVTSMGGAVIFGLSRDLGAYSVTLLLDGNKASLWFNGDADLNHELDNVMGTLAASQ